MTTEGIIWLGVAILAAIVLGWLILSALRNNSNNPEG